MYVSKTDSGRVLCSFDKPTSLNIAGKKIKGVSEYSYINYSDAATKNGKYYQIHKPNSDISLYTHDNKFYLMNEHFPTPRKRKIGGHILDGEMSMKIEADGTKTYKTIGKNFRIKSLVVNPDGSIIPPQKGSWEKFAERFAQKSKNVSKFLKFF